MKAPRSRGAPFAVFAIALGRLGLDGLRLTGADRNLARLFRLGDLENKIDVEKTVLQRGALHLDVVGKLEHALEGASRTAPVGSLALGLAVLDSLPAED